MKIDNSIKSVASNAPANDVKKRSEAATASSAKPEDASNAILISSQVTSEPVVDMSRVQEIKQAISEGAFKVNAEVVADRLLDTAKELIQSKKDQS